MSYDSIKSLIDAIKEEATKGLNTATRIGTVLLDILDYAKDQAQTAQDNIDNTSLSLFTELEDDQVNGMLKAVFSVSDPVGVVISDTAYQKYTLSHADGTSSYLLVPDYSLTRSYSEGLEIATVNGSDESINVPEATESQAGVMTALDKKRLDAIYNALITNGTINAVN